jgi:hypothetical protein
VEDPMGKLKAGRVSKEGRAWEGCLARKQHSQGGWASGAGGQTALGGLRDSANRSGLRSEVRMSYFPTRGRQAVIAKMTSKSQITIPKARRSSSFRRILMRPNR